MFHVFGEHFSRFIYLKVAILSALRPNPSPA